MCKHGRAGKGWAQLADVTADVEVGGGMGEVAMWRGSKAERAELEREVEQVKAASWALLLWQYGLAASTSGLEYAGALLNYVCVAIPIFGGIACLVPL